MAKNQTPAPDRISCCIPGCRRTCRNDRGYDEWVCAKHWSLVPKSMRRAYASVKRRRKPWSAVNRIWRRCRTRAIEENFMRLP